jgi:hypothetical protein
MEKGVENVESVDVESVENEGGLLLVQVEHPQAGNDLASLNYDDFVKEAFHEAMIDSGERAVNRLERIRIVQSLSKDAPVHLGSFSIYSLSVYAQAFNAILTGSVRTHELGRNTKTGFQVYEAKDDVWYAANRAKLVEQDRKNVYKILHKGENLDYRQILNLCMVLILPNGATMEAYFPAHVMNRVAVENMLVKQSMLNVTYQGRNFCPQLHQVRVKLFTELVETETTSWYEMRSDTLGSIFDPEEKAYLGAYQKAKTMAEKIKMGFYPTEMFSIYASPTE